MEWKAKHANTPRILESYSPYSHYQGVWTDRSESLSKTYEEAYGL